MYRDILVDVLNTKRDHCTSRRSERAYGYQLVQRIRKPNCQSSVTIRVDPLVLFQCSGTVLYKDLS